MTIGVDASRAFGKERTGTENYSYYLLRELVRLDRKNKYVLYTRGDVIDKDFEKANVWIRSLRWPRLWTQVGLALATWRDQLDLLFVPAHTLPVMRKLGIPTVVTIHGVEYQYLPEHYHFLRKHSLTWSTRYAVMHASRLVAVSQFTKDALVEWLAVDPEKVSVIHEGVDAHVFGKKYNDSLKHSVLEQLKIEKPYVLFTGVLQPRKNLVRLIQAFAELTRSGPVKAELVIAGKRGWMDEEIRKAPRKYGVEDRVKFLGFVNQEDLPILFQEASLYVQPSLTEGFGLPVLEAMAAGVPVVASKAGALPEVVGEAGLLVEPTDVGEMCKAMELVLNHPELAEGLREKGFKRVKQFTWEKAARKTLRVFQEIGSN